MISFLFFSLLVLKHNYFIYGCELTSQNTLSSHKIHGNSTLIPSPAPMNHTHHPIVFFHTKKCGGWTIHHYFSHQLHSQDGNTCNNNDWRCDMKFLSNTPTAHQCQAFKRYYHSKYQFSQVEHPLLRQQIFPAFISFMTVLRHPIERVLSSYRMFRNIFLDDPYWSMKAWLLHTPVPPFVPQQNKLEKSHRRQKGKSSRRKRHLTLTPSSSIPTSVPTAPRTLRTDGLEENYMTKWFCGIWSSQHSPPADEACYLRAIDNLNHFDFVFLTDSLVIDLPLAGQLMGLNISDGTDKITSYNVRAFDPQYKFSRNISYTSNIKNLSSIPEFSRPDQTYEIAVKLNLYDMKLYRHAIYRNCMSLNKAPSQQDCRRLAASTEL